MLLLASVLDELEMREDTVAVSHEDIFSIFRASMLGGNLGGLARKSVLDAEMKLLMSYRVLDIQCLIEGARLRPTKPSGSALAAHFKKLKTKAREHKMSTPSTVQEPPTGPLISLYVNLAGRLQKHGANQALMNIISATLHLACLLRGRPYLPHDITQIEALLVSKETETLDHAELLRLRSSQVAGGKVAHHHLQNTLFLALMASPLLILLPRAFTELSGKEALLKTWDDIGCLERPPNVLKAEQAVWGVLFAAARGADLLSELATVMEDLGSEFLEAAPAWLCVEGQPDSKVKDSSVVALQPNARITGPPPQLKSLQMEDCMHTFGVAAEPVLQQGPASIVSQEKPSLPMSSEPLNSLVLSGMLTPPDDRNLPSQATAGGLPLQLITSATVPMPSPSDSLDDGSASPLSPTREQHPPAGPPPRPPPALGSTLDDPKSVPALPSSALAFGSAQTIPCSSPLDTTGALCNITPFPDSTLPLGATSTQHEVPVCEHSSPVN
ncbi:hypothetical protein DXG01_006658, partial [Tephrocybe rancida]